MAEPLDFKHFITVDYRPGQDDLTKYRTQKRKRGGSTNEALSFSQRRAKARQMKKIKAKLKMGARKAKARTADLPRLKKRARKQAMNQLFKKFSKGKSRQEVPPQRRAEIEKRLEKMKGKIDRMAVKLLPQARKKEMARKSARNERK